MEQAISTNVRFARQAHHTALWAASMTKRFPEAGKLYAEMARRNRESKRYFMRKARSLAP